jgi:hypothetical protein
MIKIEFDTAQITLVEARGLIALLNALPNVGTNGPPEYGPDMRSNIEIRKHAAGISSLYKALPDTLAPDGFPSNYDDIPREERVAATEAVLTDALPPERDSDGIPWDERIHASTKTRTQAGTWTRRRNTPDATFDAVMAELRGANTARTMEAAAPLVQPEPTAADAFAPAVPAPPVAAAPTPPPAPAPAPAPATGSAPTFVQLMQKITAAQQAGKLDKAKLDEALGQCGLEGVAKLVTADDGTRAAFDAVLTAAIG